VADFEVDLVLNGAERQVAKPVDQESGDAVALGEAQIQGLSDERCQCRVGAARQGLLLREKTCQQAKAPLRISVIDLSCE
jgi:hypothetical protein